MLHSKIWILGYLHLNGYFDIQDFGAITVANAFLCALTRANVFTILSKGDRKVTPTFVV